MSASKTLPGRRAQILGTHAGLIQAVVAAVHNRDLVGPLEQALAPAVTQGWTLLIQAIRLILQGRRDAAVLRDLDEDDRVIVGAILQGLADPSSLPQTLPADPTVAAPGLGILVASALDGDQSGRAVVLDLAAQMVRAEGSLGALGAALRLLLQGETNVERLARGMDTAGRQLLLDLLTELAQRRPQ